MSRLLALATILVLVGPGSVLAEEQPEQPFAHTGVYLGLSIAVVGYTQVEDDLEDMLAAIGYVIEVDAWAGVGPDARLGYRLHPRLAAEIQFQYASPSKIEFENVKVMEIENWILTGNVKGYILTGRIQPFLLAGVGMMHFEVQDKVGLGANEDGRDLAARFGVGADFYIVPSLLVSLDVDYVLPTGDVEDLDYVAGSLGFQYRF